MPSDHVLNPDDILSIQQLADAQLTPDGEQIAFVVTELFKEKTRRARAQIWSVPAAGGEARPFSAGPRSDVMPRWSPDGTRLAFLSDRLEDGRLQLYVLPRAGGEARALTDVKGGIDWLQWSPDGRQIALLIDDAESEDERQRREAKDDPIEYEKTHKFTRVWVVDVATHALRCVTGDYQVWEAEWSADGQHFAVIASAEPYEWSWYEAYLARVPAQGGAPVTLANPVPRQISTPVWSPDGRQIAYLSCAWSDRGSVGGDLYVVPFEGGSATNLTVDYRGSVRSMEWLPDGGGLLVLATEDARSVLSEVRLDGQRERLWLGEVGLAERFQPRFSQSADRRCLAVIREDLSSPRDVWLGERRPGQPGEAYSWRKLTQFNTHTAGWRLGTMEEVRWPSQDGLLLQGFLLKPPGHSAERRYPLITIVHGGPTALYDFRYSPQVMWGWAELLATRGYLVFLPNPRGSTGWGTAFAEANLGDMGGKDMDDVLAGIDDFITRGLADPDRLGVCGWSYGGFATAWLITQTPRFKAAIVGAGITNWLSFHGVSTLSTWDQQFYLASPYERDGAYERFSPISHVTRVSTPTLILHGEQDSVVPVGQAYELFRALKELRVPVELVVYPREGHGILEKAHRRHVLNAAAEWMLKHIPAEPVAGAG